MTRQDGSVLLECCQNYEHGRERLRIWAGHLRSMGLHTMCGVYLANVTGTGWTIRLARQDDRPMSLVVQGTEVPLPRPPAE